MQGDQVKKGVTTAAKPESMVLVFIRLRESWDGGVFRRGFQAFHGVKERSGPLYAGQAAGGFPPAVIA
jgi:hypothetical protein